MVNNSVEMIVDWCCPHCWYTEEDRELTDMERLVGGIWHECVRPGKGGWASEKVTIILSRRMRPRLRRVIVLQEVPA